MILFNISVITLVFLVVSGWSPTFTGKVLSFVEAVFSLLMLYMFALLAHSLYQVANAGSLQAVFEKQLVQLVYIFFIVIVVFGNILRDRA